MKHTILWSLACAVLGTGINTKVAAAEFEIGDSGISVELKTEASFGARVRMEDRDARIVGKLNVLGQQHLCDNGACNGVDGNAVFLATPGAEYPDYDNGNLNYDRYDLAQATSRLSGRLAVKWGDYGVFARGVAWYDPINADFAEYHPDTALQPAHTRRSNLAVDDIGMRFELMEAYAFGEIPLWGDNTATLRVGRQIMYWGESNFLVLNSLNVVNPPDANRLAFPGGNPDEVFTPVPMLQMQTQLPGEVNLQAFYQYGWEPVQAEPAGSYFSTDDTVGNGGLFAHLDGKLHEDPLNQVRPNAPLSNAGRTFYRLPDREPKGGGQYGASLGYFASDLGEGVSFGLHFANYHNRLPVGSFVAAQQTTCRAAPPALDGTPAVIPFCLAGEPAPIDTLRYFLEYPEDVRMYGLSAVTTRGVWSFQAEYAYRPNLPVQVDSVDLVYAALQPALPREDVLIPGVVTVPGARHGAPDYVETRYRGHSVGAGDYIRGYERMKVGQLNLSTILLTPDNPFGASQMLFLVEAGLTQVLDFPSLGQLQFEGPGTSNHYSAGIDGTGDPNGQTDPDRTNYTQQTRGFATAISYGYHLYMELEYPDALLGLTLKPILHFGHDVRGTAVGNGGNFVEGRKQADIALNLRAAKLWSAQLQYTGYTGAGEFNLLRDRDNLALSVTVNF